jgi:hypothetical protein
LGWGWGWERFRLHKLDKIAPQSPGLVLQTESPAGDRPAQGGELNHAKQSDRSFSRGKRAKLTGLDSCGNDLAEGFDISRHLASYDFGYLPMPISKMNLW